MSGNLTNLGYAAQTKNLYVSNIYYEKESGTVTISLPTNFSENSIEKIVFDTTGDIKTLGALKLYSGTDLSSVFTSTNRYSVQLNTNNDFEIYDNVNNDWRIRINATTGVTTFNPPSGITVNDGILTITNGTYITGSGTFTANQASNTNITIGTNATSSNTASTLVARDTSGNFVAGTITATLTGNATSASSVYVIQNSANADYQIPILTTSHAGNGNYALKVDGNTSNFTYNTNTHTLKPININLSGTLADATASVGTSGQYLTSTVTGTSWVTLPTIPTVNNGTLTISNGTYMTGSGTFTANQAGNTSITIGTNATDANTASTLVARDASGNFTAGTITASTAFNLTGGNSIQYNSGSTRTVFSGGSGISVNSGVSVGTAYTNTGIVGLSMICNSLNTTDVMVIYDNTVTTKLFNITPISINTTLPMTSTSNITATNFIGSLTGPATLIATTLQTTGTQYITFVPLSATTSTGQVAGTHASLFYNVASSTLTVPTILSSGFHYVYALEATAGVKVKNGTSLELEYSVSNSWALNTNVSNTLSFFYYNGLSSVTKATLTSAGLFTAANLTATSAVNCSNITATSTVNCSTITQVGTSTSTFAGSINMVGDLYFNTGGVLYQRDQVLTNFRTYLQTYNGDFYCVRQQISPAVNTSIFYGSPTRFNIVSQLNVGNGTPIGGLTGTTPNVAAFLVPGGTTYVSLQMGRTSGGGDSWFWIVYPGGVMTLASYGSGTTNLVFYSFGDTTQTAYSYAVLHVNTSDIRLKEHIDDLDLQESKQIINKLKPKEFCWIDRNGQLDADGKPVGCPTPQNCCKRHWGFIAQEIESDFDVANHPIGLHHVQPNEEKTQGLDYCQIVAPLVKCVQDLMATVETQSAQIAQLQALLAKNNIV